MPLNLIDAERAILANTRAGNATLIRSPSGYGKSTMLIAAYHKLKTANAAKGKSTGLGIIFAATQTPTDLVGLPWKGERTFEIAGKAVTFTVTDPSFPLWMLDVFTGMPATCFDQFVLIIEEYGQGEPETKRALAEIFLNGGTPPYYLPKGSARWACTNSGARYGVTKDFLFAIARRSVIDILPDVDVLVDHWDKPYEFQGRQWQMSPVWKAWAKTSGASIIFETEPKDDNPWCNPRTMSAADRAYQVLIEDNHNEDINPSDPLLIELFQGTIGAPATQSCVTHLTYRTQLPDYEEVVADPLGAPCPHKGDLQMLMAYEMAARTKPDHLAQAITYIGRLNADMSTTYLQALMRRDYKGFIQQPAMQAWMQKNSGVVSLLASLTASV